MCLPRWRLAKHMPETNDELFIVDASSMITLFHRKVSVRKLNSLVDDGRLKIPRRVAAELKNTNDKCGIWVRNHIDQVSIRETTDNVRDLARILTSYKDTLTTGKNSADGVIVAMGLHFKGTRTVVSDDVGIQTACHKEDLHCLPVAVFRRLTEL